LVKFMAPWLAMGIFDFFDQLGTISAFDILGKKSEIGSR